MKNFFNHKYQKGKFQVGGKGYVPLPKKRGKPLFLPGDLVGFRIPYLKDNEAIVLFHRHNKYGALEYVVEIENFWSNFQTENAYESYHLFLKPLTRKVLFEKRNLKNITIRNSEIKIIC